MDIRTLSYMEERVKKGNALLKKIDGIQKSIDALNRPAGARKPVLVIYLGVDGGDSRDHLDITSTYNAESRGISSADAYNLLKNDMNAFLESQKQLLQDELDDL